MFPDRLPPFIPLPQIAGLARWKAYLERLFVDSVPGRNGIYLRRELALA